MIDLRQFIGLRLRGGFVIQEIKFTNEPLVDALEREAIAQTRITNREFRMMIRPGLSEPELSVTLYHEILEAAFERAAQKLMLAGVTLRQPI